MCILIFSTSGFSLYSKVANRHESNKKAEIEDESSGQKDAHETEEDALRDWGVFMEFNRQQEMSAMVSALTNVVSGHGAGGSYLTPPSVSGSQKRSRQDDTASGGDDHFRALDELTYGAESASVSHATTGNFLHHLVVR